MTTRAKIKYIIATIVLFALFIVTTAYTAKAAIKQGNVKIDSIAIDFTYGLLLLSAFAFGGIVTGISSVLGISMYILLNNKNPWLALLGLMVGLVAGISAKLVTFLKERKKLDAKALTISASAFYLGIGAIFLAARIINGPFYFAGSDAIRFIWPLYVLPFILALVFIVATIFEKKMQENLHTATCKAAFVTTAVITIYTVVAFLCSLNHKLSMTKILANTYKNYLINFYVSAFACFLGAMVIYLIIYIVLAIRNHFKSILNDVE